MGMKQAIAALGLMLPGAAWAQGTCPEAEDLARGVELSFSDGSTEVYRAAQTGVMSLNVFEGGVLLHEMMLAQGTHLLSFVGYVDGAPDIETAIVYNYRMPIGEMPPPEPGGRWTVSPEVSNADGPRDETQWQAYGGSEPVMIGGCAYSGIPVLIAYDTEDAYTEQLVYVEELGLAYLLWSETTDLPREPRDVLAITVTP